MPVNNTMFWLCLQLTWLLRQDGRIIETAALSVEPDGVERRNTELGLDIDDQTVVPDWYGDACDYSVAISGLAKLNGVAGPGKRGSAEPFSVEAA